MKYMPYSWWFLHETPGTHLQKTSVPQVCTSVHTPLTPSVMTPNPTQPNPTQPNPTQPNPTQPNPTQPLLVHIRCPAGCSTTGSTGDAVSTVIQQPKIHGIRVLLIRSTVPFGHGVDLMCRGRRKSNRGNTGAPTIRMGYIFFLLLLLYVWFAYLVRQV